MKRLSLLITFMVMLHSIVMAQQPEFRQLDKHTFSLGKQKGCLHEFEKYFSSDEKKKKYFSKFNTARQVQRGWNYAGIVV